MDHPSWIPLPGDTVTLDARGKKQFVVITRHFAWAEEIMIVMVTVAPAQNATVDDNIKAVHTAAAS